MTFWRTAMALAVAIGAIGCGDTEPITVVFVTVDARPGVSGAARLDVTVRNDTDAVSRMFDVSDRDFPLTFTVTPTEREGTLEVDVIARDGGELVVGAGVGAAAIEPDRRVDLDITLDPSDFVVNSSIAGTQRPTFNTEAGGRQLATAANGEFYAAFVNDCAMLGRCDVLARRFAADGAPAVNETTQNSDEFIANLSDEFTAVPAVAIGQSAVLMAWQTNDGIRAVALSVEGNHLAVSETLVSETMLSTSTPDVAALASGEFVVVWSEAIDTGDNAIVGRLLDANGAPIANAVTGDAAPFPVSAPETGFARVPIVSPTGAGRGFVVTWKLSSGFFDGAVRARFFNSGGTPAAVGNGTVASFSDGGALGPHVVALDANNALVTYSAQSTDDPRLVDGAVVVVPIVGPTGNADGAAAFLSDALPSNFLTVGPDITRRADGTIAVVWHQCDELGDGQGCGIFLQRLRASGAPIGNPQQVNTTTIGDQTTPSIAPQPDSFVVIWADESTAAPDTSEGAVRGRLIFVDGPDANDGRRGARCGRADDAECAPDLVCAPGSEGVPLCHAACNLADAVPCPGGGICTAFGEQSACVF